MLTLLLIGVWGWMWAQGASGSLLTFAGLLILRSELGAWCHRQHERQIAAIAAAVGEFATATAETCDRLAKLREPETRTCTPWMLQRLTAGQRTH